MIGPVLLFGVINPEFFVVSALVVVLAVRVEGDLDVMVLAGEGLAGGVVVVEGRRIVFLLATELLFVVKACAVEFMPGSTPAVSLEGITDRLAFASSTETDPPCSLSLSVAVLRLLSVVL